MVGSGIPRSADLNDLDEDAGTAFAPINIRNGVRWSAALAYLDPVRNQGDLNIVGDALVEKINLRGSRATSVDFIREGERMTVEAETSLSMCGYVWLSRHSAAFRHRPGRRN